jgi:FAD/FMN-containing dehydrogenase
MYEVAMKRYGGVPMRVKSGFPDLRLTGGYGEVLTRIKNALDPNNILSPNMDIFEEVIPCD